MNFDTGSSNSTDGDAGVGAAGLAVMRFAPHQTQARTTSQMLRLRRFPASFRRLPATRDCAARTAFEALDDGFDREWRLDINRNRIALHRRIGGR